MLPDGNRHAAGVGSPIGLERPDLECLRHDRVEGVDLDPSAGVALGDDDLFLEAAGHVARGDLNGPEKFGPKGMKSTSS